MNAITCTDPNCTDSPCEHPKTLTLNPLILTMLRAFGPTLISELTTVVDTEVAALGVKYHLPASTVTGIQAVAHEAINLIAQELGIAVK